MNKQAPDIANIDPVAKAAVLLEALPYIQRFRGSKFVIKYGGSFMDDPDPAVTTRVITDMVFLAAVGIQVIVVHGGGKAISRAMEAAGLQAEFKNGLRVTDAKTIDLVHKTLNGEVNEKITKIMQSMGGMPIKIQGETVLNCEKSSPLDDTGQPIDLGYVGQITEVDSEKVHHYVSEGFIPVISSVAQDANGQLYNTNADAAASAVASAVHARRLVYLCDVPGLMENPEDPSSLISSLPIEKVDSLKASGVIGRGMLPKVESAVSAIRNGVRRVHFIDGRMPHSTLLEIFTNKGIGTEIVHQSDPWKPDSNNVTN